MSGALTGPASGETSWSAAIERALAEVAHRQRRVVGTAFRRLCDTRVDDVPNRGRMIAQLESLDHSAFEMRVPALEIGARCPRWLGLDGAPRSRLQLLPTP